MFGSTADCKWSYNVNYLLSNDTSSASEAANGSQLKFHIPPQQYSGLESISHSDCAWSDSPFSYGNSTHCHQSKTHPTFFIIKSAALCSVTDGTEFITGR